MTRLGPATFAILLLTGCALSPIGRQERFIAAPSSIDDCLDTATIEDYVIALPPFAYHEESVDQFVDQVRRARTESKENLGKGPDYLFVGGDGCWGSKDFVLERAKRTLRIRVFEWGPEGIDYTETMRRVPGGWMRGPQVEIKSTAASDHHDL